MRRSRDRFQKFLESFNLATLCSPLKHAILENVIVRTNYPCVNRRRFSTLKIDPRFDWRLRAASRSKDPAKNIKDPADPKCYPRIIRKPPQQVRVSPGEPFYHAITAYEKRFLPLIASEQLATESIFKERLSSWSINRLRAEGYCITSLSAFWLHDEQVASFSFGPGVNLPDHRFMVGSPVLLSVLDPLREQPRKGSVISHSSNSIKVYFFESFDLDEHNGSWRLDVDHSQAVYVRMRDAIADLHHDPHHDPFSIESSPDYQVILQGTSLRDVILRTFFPGEQHPHVPLQSSDDVEYMPKQALEHGITVDADSLGLFKDDQLIHSWATRYSRPNPVVVEGDPILDGLNDVQIRAIAMMIGQRVSLVQGPPGTGKTKTIIEVLKLLKIHFQVSQNILVSTYTNVAVDNLVEGCVAAGLKPLRVSYGGNVRQDLLETTLDHQLDQHPLASSITRLDSQTKDLSEAVKKLQSALKETNHSDSAKISKLENQLFQLENRFAASKRRLFAVQQTRLRDVLSYADVVCTTCITSACRALQVCDFPVVFLDEASMCAEPASLIPLMKGSQHLALIGDHKQLPPVISSREAESKGLGISLFERLAEERAIPSIMLNIQYRMHPAISRFPSVEFYNNRLLDGTCDLAGNISSRLIPPTSQHLMEKKPGDRLPIIFLDHSGGESLKDRSRVNHNEAQIVVGVVEDLLLHNAELTGKDIGIIAPYAAQISLLSRMFSSSNSKMSSRFKHVLGEHRAMQLSDIEIKTVDGFEGRQKDIIIFSTVRNNAGGFIGFLADRRRLNVGLTRAKRGLFVIGSIATLQAGKTGKGSEFAHMGKGAESWRRYAKYLLERGLVVTLSGERLHQALYGNYERLKIKQRAT